MKLKGILTEVENDKLVDKVKEECSNFISTNLTALESENYLMRGTDKAYRGKRVVKKDFRLRKKVKGSNFMTWLYEKWKPGSQPSRQEMVPTQFGDLTGMFSTKNTFAVFPVGSRYKFHYTPEVKDLNSLNPYINKSLDPQKQIEKAKLNYTDLPEEVRDELKRAIDLYMEEKSWSYDKIIELYDELWEVQKFLGKYRNDVKEETERLKKSAENYFQHSKFTKKLPGEEGLEVNVYAPGGWYYVDRDIVENKLTD